MKDMPTVFVLTVNGAVAGVYMEKSAAQKARDEAKKAQTPFFAVVTNIKEFKVTA